MLGEFLGEVPVGISNRHVHICRKDLGVLFGPGADLTVMKPLSQPGQFAAEEKVTLVGPKRSLEGVRILGQMRSYTQVEISRTDAYYLGLEAPIRDSGDLEGTPGLILKGPCGELKLSGRDHCPPAHSSDGTRCGAVQSADKDLVQVLRKAPGRWFSPMLCAGKTPSH